MKPKAYLSIFLSILLLTGCTDDPVSGSDPTVAPGETGTAQTVIENTGELFSDRDLSGEYDAASAVTIRFSQDGPSCDGSGVVLTGTTATITAAGTYILEGSCTDGTVVVYAPKEDKVQLVLNGLDLCSQTGATIHVLQADKVFVTLAEGSQNALANGGTFADGENGVDGVVFSKEDITFNGGGCLTVTSPAGHGIVSKDELTIAGGTYTVTSAAHGIAGKDNVCMTGANVTVSSGKDGIHSENAEDVSLGFVYIKDGTFTVDAQGDGISASSVLQIDGGTYSVITGGGSENGEDHTSSGWGDMPGMGGGNRPGGRPGGRAVTTEDTAEDSASIKGLKAATAIAINGGSFTLDCADDGVHANGDVAVAGGSFAVESGDDGFHADEALAISGGTIVINESYEGLEGLHIAISGGNIDITSSDDGINAAGGADESGFGGNRGDMFGGGFGGVGGNSKGSVAVSGGSVRIFAGGDGIDANGSLAISGGSVTIHGPTSGDTAVLDYDTSATITGGTFIGTGAMTMAQTFSKAENQGIISVSVGGNVAAGTRITLADSKGNVVLDVTPDQNYGIVILSCPQMEKGETYTITVGESFEEWEEEKKLALPNPASHLFAAYISPI